MNSRKRLSLLAGFPIAWLLLAAPVSAGDDRGSLHDTDDRDLSYAEDSGDRDISRKLAAYQRTQNEEEKQSGLDRERQDSRERNDGANRYYWWWPFRR